MDEATLNTLLAGYRDELEELQENRRRRAAEPKVKKSRVTLQ